MQCINLLGVEVAELPHLPDSIQSEMTISLMANFWGMYMCENDLLADDTT